MPVGVLLCCVLLSACASERQNLKLAKNAVDVFHSRFDSEEYSMIYQAAAATMKQSTREPDFVKLLQRTHQTLGVVESSVPAGTVFQLAQGTIRLDYDTAFAWGTAREQFEWKIVGDHATLCSYKINPQQLFGK
jgi:hypothetical protein